MKIKFAFAGFRHGHIFGLLSAVQAAENCTFVAACEEDQQAREELAANGTVELTHDNYERMLSDIDCDAVAIGDYYGKRGQMAIRALEAGKHIILDKPICTSLAELDQIAELATAKGLAVGCQLDLRASPALNMMRNLIRAGKIGEVLTMTFTAQHPLMLDSRPKWYFEPGCHGGTINDIAIHAMDIIGWLTGREIVEIVAARTWNGKTPSLPHFNDCAQLMLRLDNNGGVLGDVSYLAPDKCGYSVPQYWRITCHGSGGVLETQAGQDTVLLAGNSDEEPRVLPAKDKPESSYLQDFVKEINGEKSAGALTTERVLRASRLALMTEEAAQKSQCNVECAP